MNELTNEFKEALQELIMVAIENGHTAAEQVFRTALRELKELADDTLH